MKTNESDFEYKGYRCVTIITDMGHRCGYVGLPEGHPLYRKHESDGINVTMKELEEDEEMGQIGNRGVLTLMFNMQDDEEDEVRLGLYFKVHGGITYAAGGKDSHHPVDSDLWWLGFDCGHAGDCPDYELLEKTWGDNEMVRHRLEDKWLYDGYEVRTLEYVQQECKNLVDQIIDLVERYYQ